MAVSTLKKLTLLAEREYLDEVLLSMHSLQAVEIIPANVEIQNELVKEYFNYHNTDSEAETFEEHDELFESKSKRDEINHLTHQIEEVIDYIAFLEEVTPKPGFFARLNQDQETYSIDELHAYMKGKDISSLLAEAANLRSRFNQLTKEQAELKEERAFLTKWQPLDFNPKLTEDFKMTRVIVGSIETERNEDLLAALRHYSEVYTETIHYSEEEILYLVITSLEEAHDVEQTLIRHRFERLNYKYDQLPVEELERNQAELEEVTTRLKRVEEEPDDIMQLLKDLKLSEEYLFNVRERKRAEEQILTSEHLFVISGWIQEKNVDKQIQDIKDRIGENNLFTYTEDVKADEVEDVPTIYENNEATSAFENIVSMFSTPKYGEMDPTPYVQPFSILFFGMMTADAGYGLLGLIGVALALKFLNLSKSLEKNLKFFGQLMIGTTAAGLFFGSFFGFELPFQVMSLTDQLLELMVISIGIGLVHLLLGLVLNTITHNRRKEYAESFTGGYSWILILLAAVGLVLNMFTDGPEAVNIIALAVILISLGANIIINIVSNENKVEGAVLGVFSIFDVTGYIGDVISYTRLTALGVASANIGIAFNLIIGLLPPLARFTVGVLIFVGLHLFNMFIGMISGYVHTLRLNYVEFFGKFYQGGGREFEPIPYLQKHISIKNNLMD